MAIRLSGLTSGMDTDAIVQELVSAYSKKTEKYEKQATKLTWKQDAWKNLNTKIYGLYTNVSNLRFSSAYNLRKASVSDATKATVSVSSATVTGTQTLNIRSTAQASYMTGGQLGKDVTAETTLEDLGYEGEKGYFKLQAADGTSKKIDFTKETKISEVINKLKEAGVNANFDENNRRIFVNAKKSGEEGDFTLLADNTDGLVALSALKLDSALISVDEKGNKTFTEEAGNYALYYQYYEAATAEGKEVWDYLKDRYNDYVKAIDDKKTLTDSKESLENTNRAWEATNELLEDKIDAVKAFNSVAKAVNNAENTGALTVDVKSKDIDAMFEKIDMNNLYEKDENGEFVLATNGNKIISADAIEAIREAYNTNHPDEAPLTVDDVATMVGIFAEKAENVDVYKKYTTKFPDETIYNLSSNTLTEQLQSNREKMAENEAEIANLEAQIAEKEQFIKDNSVMDDIYVTSEMHKEANDESWAKAEDLLGKMAMSAEEAAKIYENADGAYSKGNATKIKGTNAVIELNGVTYTSDSNNFSINGLSINALAKTDGEITITTSVDTQGIYDKVKDFLTEYNNVINEMTKLYNAESASDYEPLTDEEKEAMSDEQIEKWENKIKDSLLRRDTTLNTIMSTMVNSMAQVLEIDGQKLSLSTFGIHTLGFLNSPKNEHYAYHIDGDEDDENTSGKEDELMKAIQENPEQVEEFMKKLSENLYKAIDDKMKSTELSSAYKVYNDKEMDREAKKYADAIAKWEEKVKDKEDYYFKQFSNMEVALSKLQSQTSSISGLLGM